MSLPKIVYTPVATPITLQFVRGPQGFLPEWAPVAHDNLASSGKARERVVENEGILISFTMPALKVDDDFNGWRAFMAYAIAGGTFKFYPNSAMADWYNCVDELGAMSFTRVALGVYAGTFKFRMLMDAQAAGDPMVVLQRLMGVS